MIQSFSYSIITLQIIGKNEKNAKDMGKIIGAFVT